MTSIPIIFDHHPVSGQQTPFAPPVKSSYLETAHGFRGTGHTNYAVLV